MSLPEETESLAATSFLQRMQRALKDAKQCFKEAQERQKLYADKRREDVTYGVGDRVLLSSKNLKFKYGTPKLLPRWMGPFEILNWIGTVAYELKLPETWADRVHPVFHVSLLNRYISNRAVNPPPPAELVDGELEYEVESIVSHRDRPVGRNRTLRREYLVHWKGYHPEHDTWEPELNLSNAPAVLQEYRDRVGQRSQTAELSPWARAVSLCRRVIHCLCKCLCAQRAFEDLLCGTTWEHAS